jgi:hypothetical protein
VRPQCRNRYAEMQRICCIPLCVRKVNDSHRSELSS